MAFLHPIVSAACRGVVKRYPIVDRLGRKQEVGSPACPARSGLYRQIVGFGNQDGYNHPAGVLSRCWKPPAFEEKALKSIPALDNPRPPWYIPGVA